VWEIVVISSQKLISDLLTASKKIIALLHSIVSLLLVVVFGRVVVAPNQLVVIIADNELAVHLLD